MSESEERIETGGRIVQPTEINDLLADVEGHVRSLDSEFVRIEIEPVSSEQWNATQKLAAAVEETDVCLNCGEPLDEAGFCGLTCLEEWGGQA